MDSASQPAAQDHQSTQQQQQQLSDTDWLIVSLSGLVAVVGVYTLVLLVKNIYSARRSGLPRNRAQPKHCDGGLARKKTLCSSCTSTSSQPDACARCGPNNYGTTQLGQHHPVIFGKSKDSILVPEFYSSFVQQPGWPAAQELAAEADAPPSDLSVTRVLTDDKGHSIKIRVASPPPRRQRQLARQFRLCTPESALVAPPSCSPPTSAHRDSLDSQSPLVDDGRALTRAHRTSLSSWVDCEQDHHHDLRAHQDHREHHIENGHPRAGSSHDWPEQAARETQRKVSDLVLSDTSEFDDAGSDSRQETSLDFQPTPTEPTGEGAPNEQVMDADLRQASRTNLELLLQQAAASSSHQTPGAQAQLARQASRQSSGGSSGGKTARARPPARSKSLTAAALNASFPQTGVLAPASGSTLPPVRAGHSGWPDAFNSDSRRSSSAASTSGGPFGSAPSLKLSVQPAPKQQPENVEAAPRQTGRNLLASTLAAIGRSRSSDAYGPESGGAQRQPAEEQVFLVRLLEVRNACSATALAGGDQQSGRRNSLDGLYARIFRHQHADAPKLDWQASDTASIRSSSSQAADYAQLPLVKLTHKAEQDGQAGSTAGVQLYAQLARVPGYTLTCRESDFPIRISLYLAARRSGARTTLGHCFVSLDDLASCALETGLDSADSRRNSLATSTASSGANSLRCRFVAISGRPCAEQVRPGEQLLEYRLHQTILEAIKQ